MRITVQLRSVLYWILDRVLEIGAPVEVPSKRGTPLIKAERSSKPRRGWSGSNPNLVVGDPDDLVHVDWVNHWNPRL